MKLTILTILALTLSSSAFAASGTGGQYEHGGSGSDKSVAEAADLEKQLQQDAMDKAQNSDSANKPSDNSNE